MKGKRGYIQLLLITVLILIATVSYVSAQTTQQACNNGGGIWCGSSSSGYCETPLPNQPSNYGTKDCVVSLENQDVKSQGQTLYFAFKDLTMSVKINFTSTASGNCPISLNGGSRGSKGGTTGCGEQGGNGGNGGNSCKVGSPGASGSVSGGSAGISGGHVVITAEKIIINDIVDLSGKDGTQGTDATGERWCNVWNGYGGKGGGGGGGAGGGGVIEFVTYNPVTGNGQILVNGGKGGVGGKQTNDQGSGTQCAGGSGNDAGGAGGGGGGGAAGAVISSSPVNLGPSANGGEGGKGGCQDYGLGESGKPGAPGQSNNEPVSSDSEILCNDGIDNDEDFLTDMDDPDCYDRTNPASQASLFKWDTEIRSKYSIDSEGATIDKTKYPWYNPSAPNGTDLSCGDDVFFSCSSEFSSCGSIPNALCPSYTAFGCSLGSGGGPECQGGQFCEEYGGGQFGGCTSWGDCSNYINENECSGVVAPLLVPPWYYSPCNWFAGTGSSCEGTFTDICQSLTTQTTCEANSLCNYESITNNVQTDIGYILKDGQYVCFDTTILTEPFDWRNARLPPTEVFKIYLSGNSHYISNDFNWSYCDTSSNPRFPEFAVGKYEVVKTGTAEGTMTCTSMMANLPGPGDENLRPVTCDASNAGQCKQLVENSNGQYNAFCGKDSGGVLTFSFGKFLNDCGRQHPVFGHYCQIYSDGNWILLNDYFESSLWCPILLGSEQKCKGFNPNYPPGTPGGNTIDPNKCPGRNLLGCIESEVVLSCEPSPPTGLGGELCTLFNLNSGTTGQYCENGDFVRSNDPSATDKACCVGAAATCSDFDGSEAMCQTVGAQYMPNYFNPEDEIECVGYLLSEKCCMGEWVGNLGSAVFAQDAEAFICHDLGDKDYFVECCSESECKNYNDGSGNTGIYSAVLTGSSLRNILFFDDILPNNIKRWMFKSEFGLNNNIGFKKDYMKLNDWKDYDILEFDFMFIDKERDYFLSVYSGNQKSTYNIKEYITSNAGSGILQHVVINLRPNEIDWSNVDTMNFTATPTTQNVIVVNNFFLRSTASGEKNFYCAGPWKEWVENLDGLTDSKFLTDREAGTTPSYAEMGPYQTACNAIGSFGWTGSLCCGDDTRANNYGEYFVDVKGLCWDGAPVYHDQTVSSAKALSERVEEDYLLYHNGKLFVCDGSEQGVSLNYAIGESFNGVNQRSKTIQDNISSENVLPGFSVKGSWICEPAEGWVPISSFESIRLLVAEMMNLSDGDDYNLLCGTYNNIANYYGAFGDSNPDIQAMCVMRKGSNDDSGKLVEQTIVGVALKEDVIDVENDFLKNFNLFGGFNDYDENGVIISTRFDCSSARSKINPKGSEFFTVCALLENVTLSGGPGDASVYYNKPYNLVIFSDRRITGESVSNEGSFIGFISDFWYRFKAFFKAIFGGNKPITQVDFDEDELTNMFISAQKDRLVKGVLVKSSNSNIAKVEYYNFYNSVELLGNALNASGVNVDYEANNNKQTIYATAPLTKDLNWNVIGSILRVTQDGSPRDFGNQQ